MNRPKPSSGTTMKILVVEDDATDSKLILSVLRSAGHRVLAAASAEQAIPIAAAEHPDMVLLDLELPGMDGLSFAQQLHLARETADIPLIAVTAYTDIFSRRAARAAGCRDYWVKPIDTRKLPGQVLLAAGRA